MHQEVHLLDASLAIAPFLVLNDENDDDDDDAAAAGTLHTSHFASQLTKANLSNIYM